MLSYSHVVSLRDQREHRMSMNVTKSEVRKNPSRRKKSKLTHMGDLRNNNILLKSGMYLTGVPKEKWAILLLIMSMFKS